MTDCSMKRGLTEIVPALRYGGEHHRAQQEAIIRQVSGFIADTGDGGFAVRLFEALELLPQVRAHRENLAEVDALFESSVVQLPTRAECQEFLKGFVHRNPDLFAAFLRQSGDSSAPGESQ